MGAGASAARAASGAPEGPEGPGGGAEAAGATGSATGSAGQAGAEDPPAGPGGGLDALPDPALQTALAALPPRDLARAACASTRLRAAAERFRAASGPCLPLRLRKGTGSAAGADRRRWWWDPGEGDEAVEATGNVLVEWADAAGAGLRCAKGPQPPGNGVVILKHREPLRFNTYWSVTLERFEGLWLEIGVYCTSNARASRRGRPSGQSNQAYAYRKDASLVFDCAGGLWHGRHKQPFGAKLATGDTVGVLVEVLDLQQHRYRVAFFANEQLLGAPVAIDVGHLTAGEGGGGGLHPLVHFSALPMEQVRIGGGAAAPLSTVAQLLKRPRRALPPGAPEDCKTVLVSLMATYACVTFGHHTVRLDNGFDATVGELKAALLLQKADSFEGWTWIHAFTADQLEIFVAGKRAEDDSAVLSDLGVGLEPATGVQNCDVLLNIPHLVS